MKKKTGMKIAFILMGLLMFGCILSLGYTIKKCTIPKFTPQPILTYFSNNPEHIFPVEFDFNHNIYKNLGLYLISQDIDKYIGGVNRDGPYWNNAFAFNLKGIDIDRAIAVQEDKDTYYLAYNYGYWKEHLPEIIVFSLLILVSSGGMVMVCKRRFRCHKVGSTD